ncbi:MlaD family protein [Bythopirellula polymerisocia]|uniref:Paraquat-inducible protein B n=1 Tax=Bythopirellula polymerisocia TaxID=2528003 RepID=A0A5C6CEV3_9BACT|nr:MlaD family protein [Bythopirellula polymerisocia]TWU22798.1 Paraquat-inducible protein B [Bythopirellula polymerisocia]
MTDPSHEQSYPTAEIAPVAGPVELVRKLRSRLWGVTLLCLVVAIGLVWAELRSNGTQIQIAFADGSGLVPGDRVRYRGIDVGEVKSVLLNTSLDRAVVTVVLNAESAPLAREGTRFWIERPDIRLGQVRGLDTLMGGRYVGVIPGPKDAPWANRFEGLSDPPTAVENVFDGLEIVLESSQRYGLQRGSPVSYRGVEIGHVVSVGLTNNSSRVVARTFIQGEYRSLVRENSRFWSNSGIDLRLGIHGLELDAETLATIAAGGVAMATPDVPGKRVATGHRFDLVKSPREEWLRWQPHMAIGSALLPENVPIPQPMLGVSRGEKQLGLFGGGQRRGWILALEDATLLGPADLLTAQEEDNRTLEISGKTLVLDAEGVTTSGRLATRKLSESLASIDAIWPRTRIRSIADAADLPNELVVTCGTDNLTIPLATDRITFENDLWTIDPEIPLDEDWHGACVLSVEDGYLIGIVVQTSEGMLIEPIPAELLQGE